MQTQKEMIFRKVQGIAFYDYFVENVLSFQVDTLKFERDSSVQASASASPLNPLLTQSVTSMPDSGVSSSSYQGSSGDRRGQQQLASPQQRQLPLLSSPQLSLPSRSQAETPHSEQGRYSSDLGYR